MRSIRFFERQFQPVIGDLLQLQVASEVKSLILLENYVELTLNKVTRLPAAAACAAGSFDEVVCLPFSSSG
jgi:hypothetical protein